MRLWRRCLRCSGRGRLHDDPMPGVGVGRWVPAAAQRVVTAVALNDLVAALARRAAGLHPRWAWQHRRDLLMCKVLIAIGIRVSELCGLRWRDFGPSAGTLMVEGKGSGPFAIQARRVFVCDPRLLGELQAWQEGRGDPDGALFPPLQRAPLNRGLTPGGVDRLVKDWATVTGLGRPLHARAASSYVAAIEASWPPRPGPRRWPCVRLAPVRSQPLGSPTDLPAQGR
jgi:integrase